MLFCDIILKINLKMLHRKHLMVKVIVYPIVCHLCTPTAQNLKGYIV